MAEMMQGNVENSLTFLWIDHTMIIGHPYRGITECSNHKQEGPDDCITGIAKGLKFCRAFLW